MRASCVRVSSDSTNKVYQILFQQLKIIKISSFDWLNDNSIQQNTQNTWIRETDNNQRQ